MAVLTAAQRAMAAKDTEGVFFAQVMATLSKHGTHVLITPGSYDGDYIRLARSVTHHPQGYAERFGLAALMRHELAAVESAEDVDDEALLTVISEHLFPVFAHPPD